MVDATSSRLVPVEGVKNFRDITGNGRVYRSSVMSEVTADGCRKLEEQLGVTTVFDLRNTNEIDRDGCFPSPTCHSNSSIKRIHVPGFGKHWDHGKDIIVRPNGKPWGTLELGMTMINMFCLDNGKETFRIIMETIAAGDDGESFVVHCTSGKDRTGVISMLLLLVAGVSDEEIIDDYYLTEKLQPPTAVYMKKARPPVPAFANLTDAEWANNAKAFPECMLMTLDIFRRQWGDIKNYCISANGIGLSIATFDRLQSKLMSGTTARSFL